MARAPRTPLMEAIEAVAVDGVVRFDHFMDLALYEPTHGYFSKSDGRAGRHGDFLTSPEVAPFFGACVRTWCDRLAQDLGADVLDVVEVGAGCGTLASTILQATGSGPDLKMHLVERAGAPRRSLEDRFAANIRTGDVRVYAAVEDLPSRFAFGAFIANELFDNLPVRRVMKADGWKEIVLKIDRGRLREHLAPAPPELVAAATTYGIRLAEGQAAEVCMHAIPMLTSVLRRFGRGGLLLFDYGGEAQEIAGEAAPQGTLAAHRGHQVRPDLYDAVGDQDITAHVNFTPLREAAQHLGFAPAELETQSHFLVEHGLIEHLDAAQTAEPDPFRRLRLGQWAKQLYHPELLGDAFRVLSAKKRQ